jgi:hypothetical protein
MVEVLIASLMGMTISAAIMSQLTGCMRATSAFQNQIMAADIAQMIMDNARNMDWTQLNSFADGAPRTLLVNQNSGDVTNAFFPRPLLQDRTRLTYTNKAMTNVFRGEGTDGGTVQATITTNGGQNANSVTLTILIRWFDPIVGSLKSYRALTVISEKGIHT